MQEKSVLYQTSFILLNIESIKEISLPSFYQYQRFYVTAESI